MKITENMDLYALAERIGRDATTDDAAAVLDLLLSAGHTDTSEIAENTWLAIIDAAIANTPENSK